MKEEIRAKLPQLDILNGFNKEGEEVLTDEEDEEDYEEDEDGEDDFDEEDGAEGEVEDDQEGLGEEYGDEKPQEAGTKRQKLCSENKVSEAREESATEQAA